MRIFKWLTKGHPPENLSEVIAASPKMRTDHFDSAAWQLDPDAVRALREKMGACGRSLHDYSSGGIVRGVLTGLTEAFVIDAGVRQKLLAQDARSVEIIKPFAQGTHLRPWYVEDSGQFLLAIKSSGDFTWPWSQAGDEAERVFERTYPAIHGHLQTFKDQAIKRQDKGHYWWELRACAYWQAFDQMKIVWPDISKLPRFSMDTESRCFGNTAYAIPAADYFLLGVLSSWATWFYISKTAQPLRLRGDRWQYRLFSQFMERVPIPEASDPDRKAIANLAERCCTIAAARYELQTKVQHRLCKTFGEDAHGQPLGLLNTKAQSWWELSPAELGTALKASFKLATIPLKNPRTADEWEPYLSEKRTDEDRLTRDLADAEAELNEQVYRLFNLTPDEIQLLQREVEH
jgi:hypothetical protein